jgi:hypothetical protein
MFHSGCYLVATVIHTQSVRIQICVYTAYTYFSQYGDVGRAKKNKKIKIGTAVKAACQGNRSARRRCFSPVVVFHRTRVPRRLNGRATFLTKTPEHFQSIYRNPPPHLTYNDVHQFTCTEPKRQISVVFMAQSGISRPQYATCFMSRFWHLEFVCDI